MKSVAAVILAAGGSRRMGVAKQLLMYEGRSLLSRAVDIALASRCRPVVVVVGAEAAAMRRQIAERPVIVVDNTQWEQGMGGSIAVGVAAAEQAEPGVDGVLILLCDQPRVSVELLDRMLGEHEQGQCEVVACEYGGTVGVPALFDRRLFGELRGLAGNAGAKAIIHRAKDVRRVRFDGGEVDIDTPGDYARLQGPDAPPA